MHALLTSSSADFNHLAGAQGQGLQSFTMSMFKIVGKCSHEMQAKHLNQAYFQKEEGLENFGDDFPHCLSNCPFWKYNYLLGKILVSLIFKPGQTDATCWCNIVQHCWISVVLVWPPSCTMLDDVEPSLISIKHRPTFLLFSGVNNNVEFVWPPHSTLFNARMHHWPGRLCGFLYPWRWLYVYIIFCLARCYASI